jgi:hypothetical protein
MTATMTAETLDDDPSPRRLDARMRTSLASVAASGAVSVLAAAAFAGTQSALSVGIGAALATANLWALARIVAALLPDERSGAGAQSRAAWAVLAVVKMTGLVAVAWLLMRHGLAAPLPMVVGFMSLPMGIAIGALVSDRRGLSGSTR